MSLKQDLLQEEQEQEAEQKLLPQLFEKYEKILYNLTDPFFMPEFCNESFKSNVFNLSGSHVCIQMTAGILSFVELYFAIISSVHSRATSFSLLVVLYCLFSIYSYFGIKNFKFIQMSQSYLATMVLAAISLGYIFGCSVYGFNNEISFLIMTALLVIDAFLGYSLLSVRG